MKLGVQLFGSMSIYNQDPEGYLSQLKGAGYDVIEPCVLFGMIPEQFGWPAADYAKHAALVKEHGQEIRSAHIFAMDFLEHTEEIVKLAREFGIKAFVVGFNGPFTEEGVKEFSGKCLALAAALEPMGTEVWLHNNAAEIRAKVGGVSAYEAVLRGCDGKLGAQVDTGWVVCGYEELQAFLERNRQYIRSIHHKDVAAIAEVPGETRNAPLGAGIVDNRAAYDFAVSNGLGQIVDLDNSAGDFLQDLADSAAFLRGLVK